MTRIAVRVVIGAIVLSLVACRRQRSPDASPPTSSAQKSTKPDSIPSVAAALPPSDWSPQAFRGSVYDLAAKLTAHDGRPVSLDLFRGNPVLVTMFYSTCPNACPLLTTDLKRIDQQVSAEVRARLRVLMVSFDARRDTPARLTAFMNDHHLDPARWELASAPEDSAREIAAVLGIRYRELDDGSYFHSSAIILLDPTGKPLARVDGIGKDPAPILSAL